MSKKKNAGFTLIELMIVVAIIAIIAAIAIPNLLRSRMSANEASAVGAMRTISTGEISFQAAGFRTDDGVNLFANLVDLHTPPGGTDTVDVPGFIDATLGVAPHQSQGYTFNATPIDADVAYTATAVPINLGRTGHRHFFVDDSGVIRANGGAAADEDSPPIE